MIPIRYIGNKPAKVDNVLFLTWAPGEVKEVSEHSAARLLYWTDSFEDARSAAARKKSPVEVISPWSSTLPEPEDVPLPRLEGMTKEAMATFIQAHFNEEVDYKHTNVEDMRAKVRELMRSRA